MAGTAPILHGITLNDSDGASRLRFGLNRFLGLVAVDQLFPVDHPRRVWPYRRIDERFLQASQKLQDTLWKLDRVASWHRRAEIEIAGDPQSHTPEARSALRDLPIYLDSLLVYLRIVADTTAGVVPYFYPRSGREPRSRSFTDVRTWFRRNDQELHARMRVLFTDSTKWYDDLCGREGRGLREFVVHHGGTFHTSVTITPPELAGAISSGLVTHQGYASADVASDIRHIVTGMCQFLDAFTAHHVDRLRTDADWTPIDPMVPHQSEFYRFDSMPLSGWLYPVRN